MKSRPDDLNPAQRDAVTTTEGPLLVLAGAGIGQDPRAHVPDRPHRRATWASRPRSILAITFTNKAAAGDALRGSTELVGRRPRHVGDDVPRVLRAACCAATASGSGFTRAFSIYDEDDRKRMIDLGHRDGARHRSEAFPIRGIASRISSAKNELVDAAEYAARARARRRRR